jgi:hypothetical protein
MKCGRCATLLEAGDFDFDRRTGTCPSCGEIARATGGAPLSPLDAEVPSFWREKAQTAGGVELEVGLHPPSARRTFFIVAAVALAAFGALAAVRRDAACVAFIGGAIACAIAARRVQTEADVVISVRPGTFAWRAGSTTVEESSKAIASFGVFTTRLPDEDHHLEPTDHGVEAHVRGTTVKLPLKLSAVQAEALAGRMNGLLRAARE